jgi:hypothetical protein
LFPADLSDEALAQSDRSAGNNYRPGLDP